MRTSTYVITCCEAKSNLNTKTNFICRPIAGLWPAMVCKELGFPGIRAAGHTDNYPDIPQGVDTIALKVRIYPRNNL